MLNIPEYKEYAGETKIALMDNSSLAFMHELSQRSYPSDGILSVYDLILIPKWVMEEIEDSTYRSTYVEQLQAQGYPIRWIDETKYGAFVNDEDVNLYYIVEAAVSRVSELMRFLRRKVKTEDLIDLPSAEEWMNRLYDEWPIHGRTLSTGRTLKKNAGEISLTILAEIFAWYHDGVDSLTIYTQDTDAHEFQTNPPVGVKFEADNIYTLDSNGRMILTILASVAEEESHSKSIIMNWSIDRRFSRGLFLTPALLGYDKDEEGNLVINPEEAQTVKVIYYLYLNGYSLTEIATLLMEYSRKTKLGRVEWNPGTLAGVLANERHCGDVLARKTFTPNFLTHKSKKNNNDRTQYRQKNHHEAIVSREVFNAANHLRASRNYSKKNRPLPVLSVVEDGILRGYVPFDKDWTGFSTEAYREASESVMKEPDVTVTADVKKRIDLTGYEVVRAQYFSTMQNPAMTISNGRLRFNTACLKKFENVEYVELLLNSVERCIAIRPCDKNNPNAIRWGRLKEGRWCASTLGCRGLAKTLFDIMEWNEDLRYRFRGQFLEQGDNKMMLFAFDEPEMIKVEEIVLPPKENTEEDEGETVKKKIYIFPPEWVGTFGQPITSIAQVGILRQEHYAGNWDVFRPASEIEKMNIFTAESLNELLHEAEKIMEGWTDYR